PNEIDPLFPVDGHRRAAGPDHRCPLIACLDTTHTPCPPTVARSRRSSEQSGAGRGGWGLPLGARVGPVAADHEPDRSDRLLADRLGAVRPLRVEADRVARLE